MVQVTRRTSNAIEVIGKETANRIKAALFGDKTEFSRTDAIMFGRAVRKEAVKKLASEKLDPKVIAENLGMTLESVRYYLS